MEKREPSYTVDGNVTWCSHYREQYGGFLKKLKIKLPCDPAVPLLVIYPKKAIIQNGTRTHTFTAAPFTIARHGNNLSVH